ncbi:Uncharacterized protein Fot_31527 [Forsythia ovata]|uniref:Pentatricopeptide repeat-containing protein n=1 Tax=Forsythia ovata TaxID=205694 RepID=A0ABD1T596_9LAMI
MKDYGIHPNHNEYNKLIKSLCLKALDWETAEKLREEMKENGLILNGRTTVLINAVNELQEEGTSQEVIKAEELIPTTPEFNERTVAELEETIDNSRTKFETYFFVR